MSSICFRIGPRGGIGNLDISIALPGCSREKQFFRQKIGPLVLHSNYSKRMIQKTGGHDFTFRIFP